LGRSWLATLALIVERGGPAWITIFAALALTGIGILGIDTAEPLRVTAGVIEQTSGWAPRARTQATFLIIALCVAGVCAMLNHRRIGTLAWPFYFACIALLIFLLLPFIPTSIVRPRGGARSWIDLGPMNFQPSELTKIAFVLAMAWTLRYTSEHRTFKGLARTAVIAGVPIALIMLQPDLGTAMLFVPALFFILIAAGARLRHLTIVVALAFCFAPAAYPLLLPHQKARINGLIQQIAGDTSANQDINMQSVTAQRLIGAGKIVGLGDEKSRTLQHFNALPERHNDMVLASIVSRFGLLGGLLTIGMCLLWVLGALWTAAVCEDPIGRLLCVGAAGFFFAQTMVNIGMNLGLLPIIGITLPLVSYGGSSLVVQWMFVGLVAGVAIRRKGYELRRSFEWD
jgi:cell division protein FtsW (lipid II flippase)